MVQYTDTFRPAGFGVDERRLHQATGLRNFNLCPVISTNFAGVFAANAGANIGTADLSRHGTWPTGLRAAGTTGWNPVLPFPMTPVFVVYAVQGVGVGYPQTIEIKLRIKGTDQFGCYQEEITPWVNKVQTQTNATTGSLGIIIVASKVFATVDEVYVMTSNIVNTANASTIACGWATTIDPTKVTAGNFAIGVPTYIDGAGGTALGFWELQRGSNIDTTSFDTCGTFANWGIGTPFRVNPYGPDNPFPTPEIVGATATILRQKTTPTALGTTAKLPVRGQKGVAGAVPVTGVAVGRSVSGWQGAAHKIGFFSGDAWTTKIAGIDLGGSSTRASGTPTTEGQVGEDELMLTMLMRTWDGTRRDSNPTRSYPRG